MGWFFGLKIHIAINNKGEIMNFQVTPGNTHDNVPVLDLMKNIKGWLFGDKGYIGAKLAEELKDRCMVDSSMKCNFF